MRMVPIGERSVSDQLPGILGLTAALFFFSILDPLSLIVMNLSSLIFFLAGSSASRGVGLAGLSLFAFLFVQAGEFSPAPLAVILAGLSFGAILRFRRFSTSFYPAIMSGLIAVVLVVTLFALFNPGGLSGWVVELRGLMIEAMEESHLRLQEVGVLGLDELVRIREAMGETVDVIITLLPAIVFLNIVLAAVLSVIVLRIATRGRYSLPSGETLKRFSFSDTFIWGIILGLLGLLIPLPGLIDLVLLNVLVVAFIFYLLRGLAVGIFWLRNKGLSSAIIGFIYTFVFLVLPPLFVVCLFVPGLLDTWFDFRVLGGGEATSEQ